MTLIFSIIGILIFAFIPILGWAYLFSYLDNTPLHSKRFIAGIIAGAISVVPVLYLEDILQTLGIDNLNILNVIGDNYFTPLGISFSVIATIVVVSIFMFLSGMLFMDLLIKNWKIYLKNVGILCLFSIIFTGIYLIIQKIGLFDSKIASEVSVGKNVFNTIGLVILYYITVGLLEESSKHFAFIPSSLSFTDSIKKGVVLAVFIALGFGFVENILYMWSVTKENSFSGEVVSTGIFRGIFSLFVHIICSIIVVKGFSKGYIDHKKQKITQLSYIKLFLAAISLSIIIHAIYDISLTLGFTAIIFIYFIIGYLYVTKIFYRET